MHGESDEVTEPTCTTVMRPGYQHNGRLLRPAMVGVTDPLAPPGLGDTPPIEAEPSNGKHAAAGGDETAPDADE